LANGAIVTLAQPTNSSKSSRANNKRSSRSFVPNSSDNENDEDTIRVNPAATPVPSGRRVLKEVSIVVMNKGKQKAAPAKKQLPVNGFQADKDSSTGPPSLDNSDYETPGTSISTTPATSIRRGGAIATASSSRKRSRLATTKSHYSEDEDMDMSLDAQLARQMQKDEYAKAGIKRQRISFAEQVCSRKPFWSVLVLRGSCANPHTDRV
jgi:DNA repair protein RAD16